MHHKGGKTHRRRHARRRTVKRGGYYAPGAVIAPGAMEWVGKSEVALPEVASRGMNAQFNSPAFQGGKRRHRRHRSRSRSDGKKRSKSRRRHRGGGSSAWGAASASYQGKGVAGMMDMSPVTTKFPSGGDWKYGDFNYFGARSGNYDSFVKAH
jgi:hypothetical protein